MAKNEFEVINNGKLEIEGLRKIGKSFLLTLGGVAIGFIADITQIADFGSYESIVAAFLPFITNVLRKWLGKYKINKKK